MAQRHVAVLFFPAMPPGQTRAHEKFPVECVGDQVVEHSLAHRRMGGEVGDDLLAAFSQTEASVGILHHQLGEQIPQQGFSGHGRAQPLPVFGPHGMKRVGLRRCIIAEEVPHHLFSGGPDDSGTAGLADGMGQSEFEQVGDRQAQHFTAVLPI